MPFLYFIRQFRAFYLTPYLIEGEERVSGVILKVVFFCNDLKILDYWKSQLFNENHKITSKPKILLWKIRKFNNSLRSEYDLCVIETSKISRPFMKSRKGFSMPRWFDTLLDVENSLDAINNNDTQKHIRKYGFSCEQRYDTDDLKFFYKRMYKPYIQTRHKDSSVITDVSYYLKRFGKKESRLFFLMKENTPVAGSFNEKINGKIKFSGIGILDGQREIVRMGAIRAIYYYMLSYYKEKNIKQINFGGTSPLLSDGLTQFKISMRAFPNVRKLYGEKSLMLLPLKESLPLRAVLKSNPLIYVSNKKIYRAVFIETSDFNEQIDLLKYLKKTQYKKLTGTNIFCWGEVDEITKWINDAQLHNFNVREFKILKFL